MVQAHRDCPGHSHLVKRWSHYLLRARDSENRRIVCADCWQKAGHAVLEEGGLQEQSFAGALRITRHANVKPVNERFDRIGYILDLMLVNSAVLKRSLIIERNVSSRS